MSTRKLIDTISDPRSRMPPVMRLSNASSQDTVQYVAFSQTKGSGVLQVIAALEFPTRSFRRQVLSVPVAAARMMRTVGALLMGGSVGREGPRV